MYRIAVCDDEKNVRDEIRNLILEWNSEVELKVFSSGEDLLENYLPYDAVFLDIDMQGMNGIETGKALRLIDLEVKIVYVTAYRDYVAGAFGVHAFQYLLTVSYTHLDVYKRQVYESCNRRKTATCAGRKT